MIQNIFKNEKEVEANGKNILKESGIYIHIPFCDHKCIYCDFYSIITSDNIPNYLTALKKEISHFATLYASDRNFSTIYFGGGTPSLMEANYLSEIIEHIKKNYDVADDAEITMETNPGTINKEKFREFKSIGINRISIGVQSFDENELKFLTRIHNKDEAIKTVNIAYDSGFKNISIDLIFNLPQQTKKILKSNLEIATALPITHISAYSLILERGTILNKMVLDGKVKLQDEDFDAELYAIAIEHFKKNNFIQYEVSNFCKPGFECRHNNLYWRYKDYLSFGTSAHSFVNNRRWWNITSLKLYITSIEEKGNAILNFEDLSDQQNLEEYVMLALRSKGLDLNEFEKLFGNSWIQNNNQLFDELLKEKFLFKEKNILILSEKGFALADEIVRKLL